MIWWLSLVMPYVVAIAVLALLERRRRRRERAIMSWGVVVPPGWHVGGVTLVENDTGQPRYINLEDPVTAAERVLRQAAQ